MYGPIVDVSRYGKYCFAINRCGVALSLLFVADVVFSTGLGSDTLHALDRHREGDSSEIRIWREALPVSASKSVSTEGSCYRTGGR